MTLKYIFNIITAICLCCGLAGCSDSKPDEPTPPEPPTATGKRTVMVYMSAHNNLGYTSYHYDTDDLEEMKTAAANGLLGANRLLVFHYPWNGTPALKEITPEGITILKEYPAELIPVEKDAMLQVISDVKAFAPAENYGLILWGHGSGWLENGKEQKGMQRSFGGHQNPNGGHWWMNTTVLADVLANQNFDYVYFDCCFMSGVEVAYQLRHATPCIVASASELPSCGMPYDRTLRYLMPDNPDLVAAATETFSYFNAFEREDRTNTMSVISTDGLDNLAQVVKGIYASATSVPDRTAVQQYVNPNDRTNYNLYFDLRHTVEQIATPEQMADFDAAMSACVLYEAATPYIWGGMLIYEVKVDHHSGLTTYIPLSKTDMETKNNYTNLDWATEVTSALFVE